MATLGNYWDFLLTPQLVLSSHCSSADNLAHGSAVDIEAQYLLPPCLSGYLIFGNFALFVARKSPNTAYPIISRRRHTEHIYLHHMKGTAEMSRHERLSHFTSGLSGGSVGT